LKSKNHKNGGIERAAKRDDESILMRMSITYLSFLILANICAKMAKNQFT
jgi:hypothetical protein